MITVTVIDDGRPQYLAKAVASLEQHLPTDAHTILINDSGDIGYAEVLQDQYPQFDQQIHHRNRLGLAGAMMSAWEAAHDTEADYVLHWEGDFVVARATPDWSFMQKLLDIEPLLAQVSLKRQPVNDVEVNAGGFIQANPDQYFQRSGYVEHRTLFTFNPCLVPRAVVKACLRHSDGALERDFTDVLLARNYSFGILGTIDDKPKVTHLGDVRASGWKV